MSYSTISNIQPLNPGNPVLLLNQKIDYLNSGFQQPSSIPSLTNITGGDHTYTAAELLNRYTIRSALTSNPVTDTMPTASQIVSALNNYQTNNQHSYLTRGTPINTGFYFDWTLVNNDSAKTLVVSGNTGVTFSLSSTLNVLPSSYVVMRVTVTNVSSPAVSVSTLSNVFSGGGSVPSGTFWGDYLYWNPTLGGGQWVVGSPNVTLGRNAGQTSQGASAVAVGSNAGNYNQGTNAISIGNTAGQYTQNLNTVAIGSSAGRTSQGTNAVAIGCNAGGSTQGQNAVSIGNAAGSAAQGSNAIAIGSNAGCNSQNSGAISIGAQAGQNTQGTTAIAIGAFAGQSTQNQSAIAIGAFTGVSNQGTNAIAIGVVSGSNNQGSNAISIGNQAGRSNQGSAAIAIGLFAGLSGQGINSIAIGNQAGYVNQGLNTVAIGTFSGLSNQGTNAVAIGYGAGQTNQGTNAIAIGYYAGQTNQGSNTIILNATGSVLNSGNSNALYIAPIRSNTVIPLNTLGYDASTREVTYMPTSNIVLDVLNISALKALDVSSLGNGTVINTSGYYSSNDGGQGTYIYNSSSTATDNGGTVIKPTTGSGRFLLQTGGILNVKHFGARGDNTGDDSAAIQATINASFSASKGIYLPGGVYRIANTIDISGVENFSGDDANTSVLRMTDSTKPVMSGGDVFFPLYTKFCLSYDTSLDLSSATNAIAFFQTGPMRRGMVSNVKIDNVYSGWVAAGINGVNTINSFLYSMNFTCINISRYRGTGFYINTGTGQGASTGNVFDNIYMSSYDMTQDASPPYILAGSAMNIQHMTESAFIQINVEWTCFARQGGALVELNKNAQNTVWESIHFEGIRTKNKICSFFSARGQSGNLFDGITIVNSNWIKSEFLPPAFPPYQNYLWRLDDDANATVRGLSLYNNNIVDSSVYLGNVQPNETTLPTNAWMKLEFVNAPSFDLINNNIIFQVLENSSTNETDWSKNYLIENQDKNAIRPLSSVFQAGDTNQTYLPNKQRDTYRYDTSFTTNRTLTLSTTGAYEGGRMSVIRTAGSTGGPWTLDVGGLKLLNQNEWCEVIYDGTAWRVKELGSLIGLNDPSFNPIDIGPNAGLSNQEINAIAIGSNAGCNNQGTNAIAIGRNAGGSTQGQNAVSIGNAAGSAAQGSNAIAIGSNAGCNSQKSGAISIGAQAGQNTQGTTAIAIGAFAGQSTQNQSAIAIGAFTGTSNQGTNAIAIGVVSGSNNQGSNAISIGNQAGRSNQGSAAIAIGLFAGLSGEGINSIAIGNQAGYTNQGSNTVAIGTFSGLSNQGTNAVAVGSSAGQDTQGSNSVAVGLNAGISNQGANSIAIGNSAGQSTQGAGAIAIGRLAGQTNQAANSIVICASGTAVNGTTASSTYIAPIRNVTFTNTLGYDPVNFEVVYSSKTFVIDHPKDDKKYLVHACLEGPEAGVYYRGIGEIANDKFTEIRLPEYAEKFTDYTVQVTPIIDDDDDDLKIVNATEVKNNKFKVRGKNCSFYWVVFARRLSIEVEPSKDLYQLKGDGPYTYLQKK